MVDVRAETAPHRVYRFGPFEFAPREGELRRNDRRVRVQDQPLRILQALVERPGEVVRREELQRELWPADTFVDFDMGLNTAMRKLRQALGDDADRPRYVETLARRGYRFVAAVAVAEVGAAGAAGAVAAVAGAGIAGESVAAGPVAAGPVREDEIDWDFWVSMANPPAGDGIRGKDGMRERLLRRRGVLLIATGAAGVALGALTMAALHGF
jgi:DNA-binding winged helix-turn-helix (wHTH) protein